LSVIQGIILGILQGIAEFLPISSSGHLILGQRIFGLEEPMFTFDIVVHIGTLLSILAVFYKDVWKLIKNPFSKMTGLLIVGTIPVVIAGFFLRGIIDTTLRGPLVLGTAFFITGILLLICDRIKNPTKTESEITFKDALIIGLMQAMALPPGISRSGATISGALFCGISREAAAKFSFMLAIIAIAGAGVLESVQVIRGDAVLESIGFGALAAGFISSAIVGFLSIKLLLKLIKAAKLKYFSFYVFFLSGFILADYIFFGIFFTAT